MIAPNAEDLEQAAGQIALVPASVMEAQMQELRAFGAVRLQRIGATGLTTDVEVGYELGLQAARVRIADCAAMFRDDVHPGDVL